MNKKYPIPTLDQKTWDDLQYSLSEVSKKCLKLYDKVNSNVRNELDEISIHLGLIDMYLGRTLSLKEVEDNLKEMIRRKENE